MAVIPLQITDHEGIDRLPGECLIRLASSSSSECGHHYHFTIIGVSAKGSDGQGSRWVSPVISAWPSLNRFGLATRNKINMDIKCCIIDKCNHRVFLWHSSAHILPQPPTITSQRSTRRSGRGIRYRLACNCPKGVGMLRVYGNMNYRLLKMIADPSCSHHKLLHTSVRYMY